MALFLDKTALKTVGTLAGVGAAAGAAVLLHKLGSAKKPGQSDGNQFGAYVENGSIYANIEPTNWYKTYPYRFVVMQGDKPLVTYALPIPPEMITVRPVYASDAIATMGGVIEECSAVTFWQIAMSGTMPHGVLRAVNDVGNPATTFREALSTTGLVTSILSGIAQPAMSLLAKGQNMVDSFSNGFGGSAIADSALAALQPAIPYSQSGVGPVSDGSATSNGYVEIHRMQKFFLWYEKVKSRFASNTDNLDGTQLSLYFENLKDGQRFRVIPKQTDFMKSAAGPYTYKYQIVLTAWEIQPASSTSGQAVDRYKNDLKTVNTLTATAILTGVKSAASTLKKGWTDPIGTFTSFPRAL